MGNRNRNGVLKFLEPKFRSIPEYERNERDYEGARVGRISAGGRTGDGGAAAGEDCRWRKGDGRRRTEVDGGWRTRTRTRQTDGWRTTMKGDGTRTGSWREAALIRKSSGFDPLVLRQKLPPA